MGDLILLRHGETEWSLAGKHTGRTDIPLTPRGEAAAAALAPLLARRNIVAAFTSPAQRAVRTAALAGLGDATPDPVLARAEPLRADGDVALVAHGHVLRVLTARYLRLEPTGGKLFRLDTGTLSTLGDEHDEPVI